MPKTHVGPCFSVWEAWYWYVLLWVVLGRVDFRYHVEFIYISPLDQAATYLGCRKQGCEGTPLAVRLWSNTFVYMRAEADTQKSGRTQGHRTRTPCWISWLWSCLNLAESGGEADISERASGLRAWTNHLSSLFMWPGQFKGVGDTFAVFNLLQRASVSSWLLKIWIMIQQ